MNRLILAIALFLGAFSAEAWVLGDALQGVRSIERDKSNSLIVRQEAKAVADRIERASLLQYARENALAERITKLEKQLKIQNEVIMHYKDLVAALKADLAELTQ